MVKSREICFPIGIGCAHYHNFVVNGKRTSLFPCMCVNGCNKIDIYLCKINNSFNKLKGFVCCARDRSRWPFRVFVVGSSCRVVLSCKITTIADSLRVSGAIPGIFIFVFIRPGGIGFGLYVRHCIVGILRNSSMVGTVFFFFFFVWLTSTFTLFVQAKLAK